MAVGWSYLFPDEKIISDDKNFYLRAAGGLLFIVAGGVIISWPEIKKLWGTIVSHLSG